MNDRRRTNRSQLLFNARVYDADRGSVIGHLSNLSEDGLMVVTEQPLPVGRDYRVRIPLPVEFDGVGELTTDTTVAWTEPATHPAYQRNGLRAESLDAEQRRVLTRLIEDYDLRIGEDAAPKR
ncbi:MAG: PilZ domain-containing protein [Halofilum sp. (in: g-proteobacteria)]